MLVISEGSGCSFALRGFDWSRPAKGRTIGVASTRTGSNQVARPMRRLGIFPSRLRGLVGQPELDAQGSRKIRRLAIALGWLETNLCGSLFRRLVEPVSQRFDHADDSCRAGGLEDHYPTPATPLPKPALATIS